MKCKGLGGTETSLFVVFQGGNYYLWPILDIMLSW